MAAIVPSIPPLSLRTRGAPGTDDRENVVWDPRQSGGRHVDSFGLQSLRGSCRFDRRIPAGCWGRPGVKSRRCTTFTQFWAAAREFTYCWSRIRQTISLSTPSRSGLKSRISPRFLKDAKLTVAQPSPIARPMTSTRIDHPPDRDQRRRQPRLDRPTVRSLPAPTPRQYRAVSFRRARPSKGARHSAHRHLVPDNKGRRPYGDGGQHRQPDEPEMRWQQVG